MRTPFSCFPPTSPRPGLQVQDDSRVDFCIMSVLTNVPPTPQTRIRRKPAPSLEFDARYPRPDPDDPFAPLSVLRSRTASTLGVMSPPALTFRGTSTSHLPSLPYTGGRYPPDIYEAYFNAPPGTATTANVELPFDKSFGITKWLSPTSPADPQGPNSRTSPQRRRSQSAVSRKEARMATAPRNSPYARSSLHSYVVIGARSSTPTLVPPFTAEPLGMSSESTVCHGNESVHILAPRRPAINAGGTSSMPSSQVHLPSSVEDGLAPAPKKGRKLVRLFPKRAVGRLSLGHKSTDTFTPPPSGASSPGGRSSKGRQMSENTFHARRKSSALFSAVVAANLHAMDVSDPVNVTGGTLICEPLSDADLGYLSDSSVPLSRTHTSSGLGSKPPQAHFASTIAHSRSQTMDDRAPKYTPQLLSASVPPYSVFDEHAMPTSKQLLDASSCVVIAENGVRVPFSNIFKEKKTIVIFIRHFW